VLGLGLQYQNAHLTALDLLCLHSATPTPHAIYLIRTTNCYLKGVELVYVSCFSSTKDKKMASD